MVASQTSTEGLQLHINALLREFGSVVGDEMDKPRIAIRRIGRNGYIVVLIVELNLKLKRVVG
jgi:hypothetical protein